MGEPCAAYRYAMSISFSLPRDIEAALVGEFGDLGQAAKEALTIEGYRRGRLSLGERRRGDGGAKEHRKGRREH